MTYLFIIDPGHGLNVQHPYKCTPLFSDGSFMKENEFNRSVARKIDAILEQYENIDVVFTTTEKRDIGLPERVIRVNSLYDKVKDLYDKVVLISVHANALTGIWNNANGTATFYYPTNLTDKAFAEVIQKNLIAKTKLNAHRGGVVPGDFQILRDVKMTACLCECAFMDNMIEAELLRSDEFRQSCAEGIVNGLKEYFGMNVQYKKYSKDIHELKGDIKNFGVKIVDNSNTNIKESNCTNGTYFWNTEKFYQKYATSILYFDGKVYQAAANHLPCPQSCIIIYKDNTINMNYLYKLSDINLDNVRAVIGGVGLRNTLNKGFIYNPKMEGFTGAYADVLRQSNKTVIGYNKANSKMYLLVVKNITMDKFLKIISDDSSGEAYDIALMVDGGGSTFMNNESDNVISGDGRIIHNILGFNL